MEIKRFRVFNSDRQEMVGKFDTLGEVYDKYKNYDFGIGDDMFVDCVVDDIEVPLYDVIKAFDDGECPEDLQFF